MPLLNSIGPIAIPATWEPFTVTPDVVTDARSGVPLKLAFRVQSRTDAERIHELVNNPARWQRFGQIQGVLEWVETDGALARWRGWWVLQSARLSLASGQWRRAAASSYVPVEIDASFMGSSGRPVVVATHRAQPNDFAVAGVALMAPMFPSRRIEGAGTLVSRTGEGGTLDCRKQSTKRESLRIDTAEFDPTLTQLRPVLVDAAGLSHYGPGQIAQSAAGIQLKTNLLRVTISQTANLHWLVEGYVAGAWFTFGALRVRRTAATSGHTWTVIGITVSSDRVGVVLENDYDGTTLRAEIRVGERGMRILASSASYYLQWLTAAEGAAGAAVKAANYYEDSAALANGTKRFIALLNTPLSESLANWQTQINAGQQAMVGWTPSGAGADDTSAAQAAQFVYDRVQQVSLA